MGNCLKSPTSDDISLLHESQSDRASYGDGNDGDQEPPPPYQEQAPVPVYHPTPSQTHLFIIIIIISNYYYYNSFHLKWNSWPSGSVNWNIFSVCKCLLCMKCIQMDMCVQRESYSI
uniref:Uncharacterized protein n=1 Tax=Xenopus tropicalis TaxID=8364 RepID=A9ULK5_XENTR|nr:Unknown (protein for MGC:147699) [Xenopus tropicalis]